MKIGCVKEIKNNEYRVGLTPDNVKAYVSAGHHVYMEKGAGVGSGFADTEYVQAAEFQMNFRTAPDFPGDLEPETDYAAYPWWLARTADGGWQLLTWGYR